MIGIIKDLRYLANPANFVKRTTSPAPGKQSGCGPPWFDQPCQFSGANFYLSIINNKNNILIKKHPSPVQNFVFFYAKHIAVDELICYSSINKMRGTLANSPKMDRVWLWIVFLGNNAQVFIKSHM